MMMKRSFLIFIFSSIILIPQDSAAFFELSDTNIAGRMSSFIWGMADRLDSLNFALSRLTTSDLKAQILQNQNTTPTGYTLGVTPFGDGTGTVTGSGINCGDDCVYHGAYNESIILRATASENSVFVGWGGDCSGTSLCLLALNSNRNVFATFIQQTRSPKNFTLKVVRSGTGNGRVYSGTDIECGSDCTHTVPEGVSVSVRAVADSGFRFVGWSGGGCVGTGNCTVTLTRDTEVQAFFDSPANPITPVQSREQLYTLTVTKEGGGDGLIDGGGISCGSTCKRSDVKWTSVKLRAFPQGRSFFGGWRGAGCTGKGECEVLLNQNYTVNATFLPSSYYDKTETTSLPQQTGYSLLVSRVGTGNGTVQGGGLLCGINCVRQVGPGEQIVLTVTADEDSEFVGWSGEKCSGKGECRFSIQKNGIVTAQFEKLETPVNGYYEAEKATLTESMSSVADTRAFGGRYIVSGVRDYGKAVLRLRIPSAGQYVIWARVLASDEKSDSFYISIDGETPDTYDAAEDLWSNFWQWTRVTGRSANSGHPSSKNAVPKKWNLSAGTHTLIFRARDPNTKLDRIFVTASTDAKPEGYSDLKVTAKPATPTDFFTRNLTISSQGEDVRKLQIFLNAKGFIVATNDTGSPGNEGTYYGNATADAVARFQSAYKDELLTPQGLTSGTGIFDTITRTKANNLVSSPTGR